LDPVTGGGWEIDMNQYRTNPLMAFPGMLFIVAGTAVMLAGVAMAFLTIVGADLPQLDDVRTGAAEAAGHFGPMFDGFAAIVIGFTGLTIGRYLWRGARRRGWRDRLGRFLIIVGYIAVAVAFVVLTRYIIDAMGDPEGRTIVVRGLLVFLAIALPAVLLMLPGFRLAREVALMKAEAKVAAD
jgi:hypothetical protein